MLKEVEVEVHVIGTISRILVHAAAEGIVPMTQSERVTELVTIEPSALLLGSIPHHGIRWLPVVGGVVCHDLWPAPPGVIWPTFAAVLDSFALGVLRAPGEPDIAIVRTLKSLTITSSSRGVSFV